MGNAVRGLYQKRVTKLLPEEQNSVNEAFDKISGSGPAQNSKNTVSLEMFKAYIAGALPEPMIIRLYDGIRSTDLDGNPSVRSEQISKEQLTIFTSHLFKGSVDEKGSAILGIISAKESHQVNGVQVQEFTEHLIHAMLQVLQFRKLLNGWALRSNPDSGIKALTEQLLSDLKPAGDHKCFLFSLLPHMAVYVHTGYNNHYMYLNSGQQTMPNGLGMGGQHDYFGLWIDSTFGKGHSKAKPRSTTYNSPQLSSTEDFTIDVLEVWALGDLPQSPGEEGKKSVLDADPEALALLEMAGKTLHSKGQRDQESDEE